MAAQGYLALGRMTPSRMAWLEKLEREGPCHWDGHGRTRADCIRLGWSEVVRNDEGHTVLDAFARRKEWITDKGREALRVHRQALESE